MVNAKEVERDARILASYITLDSLTYELDTIKKVYELGEEYPGLDTAKKVIERAVAIVTE